jgi:hypothetical protein
MNLTTNTVTFVAGYYFVIFTKRPLEISIDIYAHIMHINTYENNIKHR